MVRGLAPNRDIDAIFVNAPLKDYDHQDRLNDFTLPVLGLGYIATYAKSEGYNVGVLDAESLALGPSSIAAILNPLRPRWVGFNLLAPTYRLAAATASLLLPEIQVMVGGHQAKAMPERVLCDPSFGRIDALVLGEGEYICAELLGNVSSRSWLPGVMHRDAENGLPKRSSITERTTAKSWGAPDINKLPFVDRGFFVQDPFVAEDGSVEANFVGSRGCPYECSFCGAAKSSNPDITIRTRDPDNIIDEMEFCRDVHGVTAVRFVDDLFLANLGFIRKALSRFVDRGVGRRFVWDATGRINTLAKADESVFKLMVDAGCREVALGIESGSARMLSYIDKRLTPDMIQVAVERLVSVGIHVKGYIIMGFPGETEEDLEATAAIVNNLWQIADRNPGNFRCSAFEFRPYPGTREWNRIISAGKFSEAQLLNYEHIDLTDGGANVALLERDEFNFSVNLELSEVPLLRVRKMLRDLTLAQKSRLR